ncbi:MAG: response regulator [archaeon]|nr:response regulator [archaeon]
MSENKKPLVMLVEDDDGARLIIRRLINMFGCEVEDCSHGLYAHRRLSELHVLGKSNYFKLILSDIDMPEMDGIAFAREAADLAPKTPFVLMTGNPTRNYPDKVKDYVSEILAKPFDKTGLKSIINKYVFNLR